MTISVRLDEGLEKRLRQASKQAGKSQSQIIKESLDRYLTGFSSPPPTPYDLGKDLFGKYGSKEGGLSTLPKRNLREKIREKNSR